MTIVVYSRVGCHLCDVAHQLLLDRRARYAFDLETIDVDTDSELAAKYGERIPVIVVDGRERFSGIVSPALLDRFLAGEARRLGR